MYVLYQYVSTFYYGTIPYLHSTYISTYFFRGLEFVFTIYYRYIPIHTSSDILCSYDTMYVCSYVDTMYVYIE